MELLVGILILVYTDSGGDLNYGTRDPRGTDCVPPSSTKIAPEQCCDGVDDH